MADLFQRVKYPRTFHLPWSPGASSDDKVLADCRHFQGRKVVVTLKMDGENTTIYSDGYVHARSIDSRGGIERDWVKSLAQSAGYQLPKGWRICGENLWARHSIAYEALPSYFMGFSLWNEKNECLSWSDTLVFFDAIGIIPVAELYRGKWNDGIMKTLHETLNPAHDEGYVVRLADSFRYDDFSISVAKWVRANHVETDKHWRHTQLIQNRLK